MAVYGKSRKFRLHLKLSKKENFLHDHELYEMMRSRQLYNVHNDLRKKLGRTIRGIQDAERVHVANIESQKILFLQRAARKAKARLRLTRVNEKSLHDSLAVNESKDTTDNALHGNPGLTDVLNPHEYRAKPKIDTNIYQSSMKDLSCEMNFVTNHREKINKPRLPPKDTSSLLPNIREPGFQYNRDRTQVYDRGDPVNELCRFQLLRSSRLRSIREYSQLLDRRVQEFRCASITGIHRTTTLLK